MASYQKHGFSLSTAQVKKLSKGDKIRIKHESLHGPHPVYLTKTQHARMSKAHAAKKGMDLQMSGAQLRHHLKHGGSIFDTLKDWGKSALGYLAPIGQKIIQDKVLPRLAARAGPLLDQAIDSGLSRLGAGTRRKKQMKGAGFFDDIWGGIKSVANTVAPAVLPIATGLVTKRLGLGLRQRHKKRAGRGLNPPGY